jgi:hypothetical protein
MHVLRGLLLDDRRFGSRCHPPVVQPGGKLPHRAHNTISCSIRAIRLRVQDDLLADLTSERKSGTHIELRVNSRIES